MAQRALFTVGHSTRAWEDFVALLSAWRVKVLIDVRTVPRSRAFPWFSAERMKDALPRAGINYHLLPALGGFQRTTKDSPNTGWRNLRFRGYADYMQTPKFIQGLTELNAYRRKYRVCIMCSEAVWWRCHRRMIADAEIARGIPVKHVMTEKLAIPHELTEFAIVKKRKGKQPVITYPDIKSETG